MSELNERAAFAVRAQVLPFDPELHTTPAESFFAGRSRSFVGVFLEGDSEGEATRIAFEYPFGGHHESPSQNRSMSRFLMLPSRFHLFRSSAGTSIQPTGKPCQTPVRC